MIAQLLRRLNLLVLTSLVLFGLIYCAIWQMPGSPLTNFSGVINPSVPEQQQIIAEYRLDGHWLQSYVAFIQQRLSGNWGLSQSSGYAILDELKVILPATAELSVLSLAISLVIGVPLGVLAAARTGMWPKILWIVTLLGFSVPVFWFGLWLMITLGLEWDLLPAYGRLNLLYDVPVTTGFLLIDIPLSQEPWRWHALSNALAHLVMPVIVVAALPTTLVIRIVRVNLREEMQKPYIRALKARGVAYWSLLVNHAMANVMGPVFRTMTLQLGPIVSTLIVVETLFHWPGIGSWLVSAWTQEDYTALSSGILAMALLIIIISNLLELVHFLLNPESRKEFHG